MDGDDTHDLDAAELDERGQLTRPPHGIAELGHHDLISTFELGDKLFPLRPERLVFNRFLYYLYAPVLLHPLFVRVESLVKIRLEYITDFCHTIYIAMITSANIRVLFYLTSNFGRKIELYTLFSPFFFHLFSLKIILLSIILKNWQKTGLSDRCLENNT